MNARTTIALLLTFAGVLLILSVPFPTTVTRPRSVELETMVMTSTTIAKGVGPEILTMEVLYGWTRVLTSQTTVTETKYVSTVEAGTGSSFTTYALLSSAIALTMYCLAISRRSRRAPAQVQAKS
ncbi:MAG: hypothetical protein V1857_06710 [archaeon]